MTMAVPPKLHALMKKHKEIKWAEVARQAIERKARQLEAEKDPWKKYAFKRWAQEGDDAEDLFEF